MAMSSRHTVSAVFPKRAAARFVRAWRRTCLARDNELRDRDRVEEILEAERRKKSRK